MTCILKYFNFVHENVPVYQSALIRSQNLFNITLILMPLHYFVMTWFDWKYVSVCFRGVHLDLRARPAHQAPLAYLGRMALMWVSIQVRLADLVTKATIVMDEPANPAVLQSYQQRVLQMKTHWHKKSSVPSRERGLWEGTLASILSLCRSNVIHLSYSRLC